MKNKKETRTCIGCRKKQDKYELIRIVKSNNSVLVDLNWKMQGRGAYICKNEECFNKMAKSNKLKFALKTNVQNEDYEKLRGVIFGGK